MNALRRVLFVALCFLMLAVPTYGYILLLSQAQAVIYGPACERACEGTSRRYEGLVRGGRGPSVTGCTCDNGQVTHTVEPRFYSDVPVVNGALGFLVVCVEVCGLFAFVYAPFGVWRFISSRRSPGGEGQRTE